MTNWQWHTALVLHIDLLPKAHQLQTTDSVVYGVKDA